ncbi:MAG: PKD domain-containing protein, partial [Bacteroidetes bacterium]|nr:PKD domain-containing protein [Bacteroidota bacterium]
DITVCSGNKIELIQGNSLVSTYLWTPGNENTPDKTINSTGRYWLYMENANGCSALDSIDVTIQGTAVSPSFAASDLCFGNLTELTNTSTPIDSVMHSSWVYGPDTVNSLNFHKVFSSLGNKTIKLIVETFSGCVSDTAITIEIIDKPVADYKNHPVCVGRLVSFISESVFSANNSIVSYQWLVDGVVVGNKDTLDFTFLQDGNYSVALEIIADNGCSDLMIKNIDVENQYPLPGQVDLVYPFNNFVSGDSIINFQWNYADLATNYVLEVFQDSLNAVPTTFELGLNNILVDVQLNHTYFWRVISYNPCGDSTISNVRKLITFSPLGIPSLNLWLKPDTGVVLDGNGRITEWKDQSSNSYNLIQTQNTLKPIKQNSIINNYPVVHFDGSRQLSNPDTIKIGSLFMVFYHQNELNTIIAALAGPTANPRIVLALNNEIINSGTNGIFPANSLKVNKTTLLDAPENNWFLISGVRNSPINFPNYSLSSAHSGYGRLNGHIAENLIFSDVLSDSTRGLIEDYLRFKYAPPVNLGPDIHLTDFCDTILRASKNYTSYLWSNGSTSDSIVVSKAGIYTVNVTDVFGFHSSDTVEVKSRIEPSLASDTILCPGNSYLWNTNLNNSDYSFLWNDNSTNNSLNIVGAGNFSVIITDNKGCDFFSDTIEVSIDDIQQLISLGPDTALCEGNNLYLIQGDSLVQNYIWNDNSIKDFLPIFTPGQYYVNVISHNGCPASDTINITIQGIAPEVLFSLQDICFNDSAFFKDLSLAPAGNFITQWDWSFGDQAISSQQDPGHLYLSSGNYNVTLKVTTDADCSQSLTKEIKVHQLPTADFSFSSACSGQDVNFMDLSESNDGNLSQWLWIFDDPASGNDNYAAIQNPKHSFATKGDYMVELLVSSEFGCADKIAKLLTVNEAPVAAYEFIPQCFGTLVTLHDVSGITSPEAIESYFWQFPDGTTSVFKNPTHLFKNPGISDVSLRVKATNGCQDSISKQVEVFAMPAADFVLPLICAEQAAVFRDSSSITHGSIVSWLWDAEEQDYYNTKNPTIAINDTGVVKITLKVESDKGCINSLSRLAKSNPVPAPDFSTDPMVIPVGYPISFINNSIGGNNFS